MKQFFRMKYEWESVYHHFQKWSKDGSWENIWRILLSKYKYLLDMSSTQLDGTHTPPNVEGQQQVIKDVKNAKPVTMLIITDNQGIPLSCSNPIAGNHNDAYDLVKTVDKMMLDIEESNILTDWLFLNADAGFDTTEFRSYCFENNIIDNIDQNKRNGNKGDHIFDSLLYKCRFVVERTNAWLDAFKVLLVRFETNEIHWKALNLLAFCIILLRQL